MLSLRDLVEKETLPELVGLAPEQTWSELARLRDAWRDALIAEKAKRAALYFENTFAFTAAVLGAWSSGCSAIIPADTTKINTAKLVNDVDVFLGEFPQDSVENKLIWRKPPASQRVERKSFPVIPIVIYTSGTTGLPLAIEKSETDIEHELHTLESVLGQGLQGACVLSTVSHQHLYGLLFRCLWPLVASRPFSDRLIRFPEELFESRLEHRTSILVTSPAFLRRLPEAYRSEANPFTAVFSSGGPLAWACVPPCSEILGVLPIEIYGSSETGGIAWRRRVEENPSWVLFPEMKIEVNPEGNLLLLRSPHRNTSPAFATSDQIGLTEQGFHLFGRADRIVKLEEKRLSLTKMEALLRIHPSVKDAHLVILPGPRETLGAVLALSCVEIPVRGSPARGMLINALRTHLLEGFERLLLPKRWRLVESMPVNTMGKTNQADLRGLFEPQFGPVIVRSHYLENETTLLDLSIPAELEYFRGHFPKLPLLPGVVQLDWAIREAIRLFGPFGSFQGMRAVKFNRPIFPGMLIRLELTKRKDPSIVSFKYESKEGRHSSGQALFNA